jgi:hypothetical protein
MFAMPLDGMREGFPADELCLDGFAGLTVIGDVHGSDDELRPVMRRARSQGRLALFLGDIINRGTSSLACIEMVLDAVLRGDAAVIPGNHEQRLDILVHRPDSLDDRYDDGKAMAGLCQELARSPMGRDLVLCYASLMRAAPLWRLAGGATFCHAAMPDALRGLPAPLLGNTARGHDPAVDAVMWGERADCFGPISYRWIDHVPSGQVVLMGHHPHNVCQPVRRTGRQGGTVVFLDTGAGMSNGRLSTLDLDREHLENPALSAPVLELPLVTADPPRLLSAPDCTRQASAALTAAHASRAA